MRRTRCLWIVLSAAAAGGALAVVVSCAGDPRKDENVTVINACAEDQLSKDPKSPQATLVAYLDSTQKMLDSFTATEAMLKDGCNEVTAALGLPAGADALGACRPLAGRLDALVKKGTPPYGAGAPEWGEVRFSASCDRPAGVLEQCVSSCAGPCDVSKCDPAKLYASCAGNCKGDCVTAGDPTPCNGACAGDVVLDKAPSTCTGECTGICTNPAWSGACGGWCVGTFQGTCTGTCSGTCEGAVINPPPDAGVDAGVDAGDDGGDAGDAGPPPDAGPAPPPPPPPNDKPGNCTGRCVGICAGGMDGNCENSPCLDFSMPGPPGLAAFSGYCPGLCGGGCRSAIGTSAVESCKGTCTSRAAQCTGKCRGACEGTPSNIVCEGTLNCGQNLECENACQARALIALAEACTPPKTVEVYAVTDKALYTAFSMHGAKMGEALERFRHLRDAYGYIQNRALADFAAIGVSGDLARACVAKGKDNVAAIATKIETLTNADPITRKSQEK